MALRWAKAGFDIIVGSRAAERAGYSGDENSLAVTGHRLLRNNKISEAISQRLSESAMTADEVLKRLASHARGSMADFVRVTPAGPQFDFEAASLADQLHLVKRLKTKTRTVVSLGKPKKTKGATGDEEQDEEEAADDDRLITEVEVDFELYDAQAALEKLGRYHKLFTDKTELSGAVGAVQMSLADWKKQAQAGRTQAATVRVDFEDDE